MNKFKFAVIFTTILCIFSFQIFAEYYGRDIPDSSEIRKSLVDRWFTSDLKYLRLEQSQVYKNSAGDVFQVRLEEFEDSFAIVVAPRQPMMVDLISSRDKRTVTLDVYPYDLAGSWILFRDKNTGLPLSIRYYFHQNSEIYVEFRYQGNSGMKKEPGKVFADFIIFGMYAVRSLPVGLDFSQLYSLSFPEVVEATRESLPWEYTEIENYLYDGSLQMIGFIREKLEKIKFQEDACYDGEQKPVKISDGKPRKEVAENGGISVDSAGFVKWIVDGLVMPIAGSNLELEPLKMPTVSLRTGSRADALSDKYNLYFSLDWTRNLAAAYLSVTSGNTYTFKNSGCEVRITPFASQLTVDGVKSIPVYMQDSGYSTDVLKALFYILAVTEPDRFYLGALRETGDMTPENIFYNRCVAFFPYFDANGFFSVAVFENGKEMSIEQFMERNPNIFVNLVRLRSSERFYPQ